VFYFDLDMEVWTCADWFAISGGDMLRRRGCLGEDGRKSSRRMREGGVMG